MFWKGWDSCANCAVLIQTQIAAPNCAKRIKLTKIVPRCARMVSACMLRQWPWTASRFILWKISAFIPPLNVDVQRSCCRRYRSDNTTRRQTVKINVAFTASFAPFSLVHRLWGARSRRLHAVTCVHEVNVTEAQKNEKWHCERTRY